MGLSPFFQHVARGSEHQVLIAVAEISKRRNRLQGDACDLAFGVQREGDARRFDRTVVLFRAEGVVLPMGERSSHVRSPLEIDAQFARARGDSMGPYHASA